MTLACLQTYKPKDKSRAEGGVLLVQRWIVATLRNQVFFSLEELNAAIRKQLIRLNSRVTRHLGASRQPLFTQLDQPALRQLPHQTRSPHDRQVSNTRFDNNSRVILRKF